MPIVGVITESLMFRDWLCADRATVASTVLATVIRSLNDTAPSSWARRE
jgi:hypothetical protein